MKHLLTTLLIFFSLVATAQIKPDTVITATDTLISYYSVKAEYDTIVSIHYDTTKVVVVKKVIKPYQRQNLIFDFTVEQSDALTKFGPKLYNYWNGTDAAASYSVTRVAEYPNTGKFSTRYELRKTDASVGGNKRAETRRASNDEPTLQERWYGASIYLPSDYVYDQAPELLFQLHDLSSSSPPFAIWTKAGQWEIVQFGNQETKLGVYEKDKRVNWVVHIKWSMGSDGLVEVWKDGAKVLTKPGKNSNYLTGCYLKTGIYKWPWGASQSSSTIKRIVYIDDVRIGNQFSNYNDVSP